MTNLFLVYVNPIGQDSNDIYQYEFFFSDKPDLVWQDAWNVQCPSACGNILPDKTTYSEVRHLKTEKLLTCAQENSCFSMADCMDDIIAVCWEDIEGMEFYPEPYRLVLHYAADYDDVVEYLSGLDLQFEEEKPGYIPPEKPEVEEEEEEIIEEDIPENEDEDDTDQDDDWEDDRYPLNLNF